MTNETFEPKQPETTAANTKRLEDLPAVVQAELNREMSRYLISTSGNPNVLRFEYDPMITVNDLGNGNIEYQAHGHKSTRSEEGPVDKDIILTIKTSNGKFTGLKIKD
ncbi:MAG: hypothetical protein WCV69_03365 [Patescibacteria group bacterium]|jgi:hypothetical protein